jgi:hypothetical protein
MEGNKNMDDKKSRGEPSTMNETKPNQTKDNACFNIKGCVKSKVVADVRGSG